MTFKTLAALVGTCAALTLTGCASIVGDSDQSVTINSTPSNANVVITDETAKRVFTGTTPTTVTLKKSDGSYFGGKTYHVELKKEGYAPRTVDLTTSANGWYIGGNILFGGLIGWLIVDPFNGGMYTLSPDEVDADLGDAVALEGEQKSLNLVMIEDVPEAMKGKLVKVGQI
ncbi:hypothetical protein [Larsenimonas suaedae]|uniref:PEGA domain-containing protein n=1 Tax=Larsenimonas suaedae TaxID=1851019 RepID=A0ABU1GXX0_9GAMM|nr:hypothetical protein [Larsenimonas suaedae]MCM2973399.1 hypothetical protein [Larsenimonas suaedae]MDR5896292.1 hypothetical protein [Larsenimonas suaedae]